jgi:hypothetical protein
MDYCNYPFFGVKDYFGELGIFGDLEQEDEIINAEFST